jgi:N-acetylmuramoyl-L-alanine amidase
MRKRIQVLFWITLLTAISAVAASKRFTLVIDAGHGGHDAGAIGAVTKEKNINLNVALAFGKLVERNCPDVKVVYTRTSDVFVPLHTRADIANRAKADLFISIHTNSLPKGRTARGLETYTLGMHRAKDNLDVAKRENSVILIEKDYKQRYQNFDPNSSESYIMFEFIRDHNMAQSVELAKAVQKNTCRRAGRQNKGVKQAGFLVLRETSMPSCLIELGFISTPDEERFLHSSSGVKQLGQGIYEAFVEYRRQHGHATADVPQTVVTQEDLADVREKQEKEDKPKEQSSEPVTKKTPKKSKAAQDLADALEGKKQQAPEVPKAAENPDADTPQSTDADPQVVPLEEKRKEADAKPEASKPAVKPEVAAKPEASKSAVKPEAPVQPVVQKSGRPVFKVQILASGSRLKTSSPQLKGQQDVDCYEDGGMYKYTVGSSEDYNAVYRLRKSLVSRFPEAFIIAFKNGKRTDVQQAIQEFKRNNRK